MNFNTKLIELGTIEIKAAASLFYHYNPRLHFICFLYA